MEKGQICIVIDGVDQIVVSGDEFQIPPNTLHSIKNVDNMPYSMVVMCIKKNADISDTEISELREVILEKPENVYLIEEMAADSALSPYHMIRKFKKAFGLTPHQFHIQSKVRKAQKLLEQNKSISEVAYEAGFYDQSHLDRCFQKIVGMTPKEYQESIVNN